MAWERHVKVPSARVLVDADACPVRREIARAAERHGIEALFFANSSQEAAESSNLRTVRVADRPDAADFAIATQCRERDIVVSDDIGLAALVTGKGARAISSRGRLFRPDALPLLLEERHRARKARRAGGRTRGPRALTVLDRARFTCALEQLLMNDNGLDRITGSRGAENR
jgi:uncharacterized protein YaiI (UPF0178 family)